MPSPLLGAFLAQPPTRTAVATGPLPGTGREPERWTFDELLTASCQIAALLRAGQGSRGRTVMINTHGPGGPWYLAADLAALLAGAVPAVAPERVSADQAENILRALAPAAVVDTAPGHNTPLLKAARNAGLLVLEPPHPTGPTSPSADACRALARRWAADRDEPAGAVVFTSGSTGTPRGVVLREQDLAAGIRAWSALWPAIPQRTVAFLPVSHVAQRITGHYLMCLFGTTVHTTHPHLAANAIEQVKPDLLLGVPRTWSGLADALTERPALAAALGEVRLAVNGAAALDSQTAQRLAAAGLVVAGAYGATETTVPAFHQSDARDTGLGAPVGGVDHRLGVDAELLIRSPYAAAGYVTRWPQTRPVTRDGWLHTGDRAHTLNGQLTLAGRQAASYKTSNGLLVHPEPIEALLTGAEHVEGACLIGDGLPAASVLVSAPAIATWPLEEVQALAGDLLTRVRAAQHAGAVPRARIAAVHVVPDSWDARGLATAAGKPVRDAIRTHYAHLLPSPGPARTEEDHHARI
ncbi:AMP-binding protein [Streptomyces sp. NPDC058409]|uniref:AMP-binding protein n=1 Tax=Streptomyces sp. NPDC058409 TaxID=3346484 RepID=UPI00364C6FC5